MGASGFQVSGIRDSGFEASGFEASGPRIQGGYPFIFVTNTSKGYIRGMEKSMENPTFRVLRIGLGVLRDLGLGVLGCRRSGATWGLAFSVYLGFRV